MDRDEVSADSAPQRPIFLTCRISGAVITSPPEDAWFPICLSCLGAQPDSHGEAINRLAVMALRHELRSVTARLQRVEEELVRFREAGETDEE